MTDTTAPARSFTAADVIARTSEYAARDGFWTGWSGESVTGHDVSEHIENVATMLAVRGWVRNFQDEEPQVPEADESMSVKALVLAGLRALRSWVAAPGPLTLMYASLEIGRTCSDTDTREVAGRVLDAVVRAYTGSPAAQANVWVEKKGRTWDEVRDLLDAAAEFAREHGPR
jgi:hypothetical protein